MCNSSVMNAANIQQHLLRAADMQQQQHREQQLKQQQQQLHPQHQPAPHQLPPPVQPPAKPHLEMHPELLHQHKLANGSNQARGAEKPVDKGGLWGLVSDLFQSTTLSLGPAQAPSMSTTRARATCSSRESSSTPSSTPSNIPTSSASRGAAEDGTGDGSHLPAEALVSNDDLSLAPGTDEPAACCDGAELDMDMVRLFDHAIGSSKLIGSDDDETLLSADEFADTFTTFDLPWDLKAETDAVTDHLSDLS